MLQKWITIYHRYQQILLYLFFGVCTVAVNTVCYYILFQTLGLNTAASTAIAWFAAVIFAFCTNRTFVFRSRRQGASGVMRELAAFWGCRLLTGGLDVAIMTIAVDCLHQNGLLWKLISNVIVTVMNYAASKLYIFKTAATGREEEKPER